MRRQRELELLNRLSFSIASEKSADATAELVVDAGRRGARRAPSGALRRRRRCGTVRPLPRVRGHGNAVFR